MGIGKSKKTSPQASCQCPKIGCISLVTGIGGFHLSITASVSALLGQMLELQVINYRSGHGDDASRSQTASPLLSERLITPCHMESVANTIVGRDGSLN